MAAIRELQEKAAQIRKDLLALIYTAKAGHTGGDLSCADIMVALHYDVLRVDPQNPAWAERDLFLLSKGHCVETYYTILADLGFITKKELATYMQLGSRLIGHPTNKVPGIEMNTGALGHGLSIGVGMAIGLKKDKSNRRVFVLMGDGELGEGSVWEAAMSGAHYGLDNLVAIIDRNRLQISGDTESVMGLEPLAERWSAFGWRANTVNGHDMEALVTALRETSVKPGQPTVVIANTVKGRGVAEMEHVAKWHHGVPDEALYKRAMKQLEEEREALETNDGSIVL